MPCCQLAVRKLCLIPWASQIAKADRPPHAVDARDRCLDRRSPAAGLGHGSPVASAARPRQATARDRRSARPRRVKPTRAHRHDKDNGMLMVCRLWTRVLAYSRSRPLGVRHLWLVALSLGAFCLRRRKVRRRRHCERHKRCALPPSECTGSASSTSSCARFHR